jgi:hypothetical protein
MATAKSEAITAFEFDGTTGETVNRELSAAELAQRELDAVEAATQQAAIDAKTAARISALNKLADLGLTAEEIAAL